MIPETSAYVCHDDYSLAKSLLEPQDANARALQQELLTRLLPVCDLDDADATVFFERYCETLENFLEHTINIYNDKSGRCGHYALEGSCVIYYAHYPYEISSCGRIIDCETQSFVPLLTLRSVEQYILEATMSLAEFD